MLRVWISSRCFSLTDSAVKNVPDCRSIDALVEDLNIIKAEAQCQESASQLVHLLLENLYLRCPLAGGAEEKPQRARGSIGVETFDGGH